MREGVGPKAYALGGILWLPIPIVAGFLGLAAPALGIGISQPDTVGPLVAATLLGTGGALLVFVIVFCSLASSIDSLLAATADLIVNDIVEPISRSFQSADLRDTNATDSDSQNAMSDSGKRRASTVAILVLGVLSWAVGVSQCGHACDGAVFCWPDGW